MPAANCGWCVCRWFDCPTTVFYKPGRNAPIDQPGPAFLRSRLAVGNQKGGLNSSDRSDSTCRHPAASVGETVFDPAISSSEEIVNLARCPCKAHMIKVCYFQLRNGEVILPQQQSNAFSHCIGSKDFSVGSKSGVPGNAISSFVISFSL